MTTISKCEKHTWQCDEEGEIDEFALDDDYHNGPMCAVCFECFCRWCEPARWEALMKEEHDKA